MRLHAILLALSRHLGSYMELGAAAAAEYRAAWIRRALLLLLAAMTFLAGSVALWLAGLMALWESGWATLYVVGSAVLLLVVSASAWLASNSLRPTEGPVAGVFKSELNKDMELLQEWTSTNLR
jgi:hypothetical protein